LLIAATARSDLPSEHAVADHGIDQHEREHEQARCPEHEGEARMCGAAASSTVMEKGIMYGQNEMASVPNAAAKISETM
jgi:hypothetical protein